MTDCGSEHPESGLLYQHPGEGRVDEHAHGHGVTANADSRYIAVLIVVGLMLHAAWGLLRETGRILLEAAPEGYAPADIVAAITGQTGVASVHDVHVWLITSGFPALSAHMLVPAPG